MNAVVSVSTDVCAASILIPARNAPVPTAAARYQKRISGPLLDRIDIFVEVPPVEYDKLVEEGHAEDSAHVRQRVDRAREILQQRFKDLGFLCNSEMGPAQVWKSCFLEEGARSLLQAATK